MIFAKKKTHAKQPDFRFKNKNCKIPIIPSIVSNKFKTNKMANT